MFGDKTTIVVGAGASKEYGFPLGSELKLSIAAKLEVTDCGGTSSFSGESRIWEALKRYGHEEGHSESELLDACLTITGALSVHPSIDQLIERYDDKPAVSFAGKLAIVSCILEAEAKSASESQPDAERWIPYFVEMATPGISRTRRRELFSNAVIVCFNYDRCIEHYLPAQLNRFFGSDIDMTDVADSLQILRPYGSLGRLDGADGLAFGDTTTSAERLYRAAKLIRTYSEQTESGHLEAIRNHVNNADTLIFLGFGFILENMNFLFNNKKSNARRFFATAYGFTSKQQQEVGNSLTSRVTVLDGYRAEKENCSCFQLLNEYKFFIVDNPLVRSLNHSDQQV